MLLKVLMRISLLVLYCRPGYSEQRNSLSHKFTSLQDHHSNNPNHMPEAEELNYYRQKYRAMQYAPLNNDAEDIRFPFFRQIAVVNNNPHTLSKLDPYQSKTTHLEPRKMPRNNMGRSIHTPFILGHNVELLQSVSRSPEHNPAYRSYPEGSNEKHNKVNLLRQYVINQKKSNQQTKSTNTSTEKVETNSALQTRLPPQVYMKKQNNKTDTYSYLNGDSTLVENIQPHLLYAKSHRLHLNVARAFDLGSVNPKASAIEESSNYIKIYKQ